MQRPLLKLALLALLTSTPALCQNNGYVLINDGSDDGNGLTVYQITAAGQMSMYLQLRTGGNEYVNSTVVQQPVAIEKTGHCVYVADSATNDIAVFDLQTQILPNFTNSQLVGGTSGIGLALDPDGRFLYTSWTGNSVLAVLSIAQDCGLSLVGEPIPQPDAIGELTVSHDGKVLVVSYPNIGGVQAYKASPAGQLSPLGPEFSFNNAIRICAKVGCYPTGQDVTDDGIYWIWGNATATGPSTLTARLTDKGFANPSLQSYPNSTVGNIQVPWFSPQAAQTDTGNLYLGASGVYPVPSGIIVTTFDKGAITYDSEVVNTSNYFAGGVQTVGSQGAGSPIVQETAVEFGDILYSYTVSGTTLTPASNIASYGEVWISGFPIRP